MTFSYYGIDIQPLVLRYLLFYINRAGRDKYTTRLATPFFKEERDFGAT